MTETVSKYAFRFISGSYLGAEFPIPLDESLLLGRADPTDIVLAEEMVSRKHAKISHSIEGIEITDLGSTNGTFVNGEKIERATLQFNDRILIGTSIIRLIRIEELSNSHSHAISTQARLQIMQTFAAQNHAEESMSGALAEVPLPDILQLFATNKKTGILELHANHQGQIVIAAGQLQNANIQGSHSTYGIKALCRMLLWQNGTFRFEARAVSPQKEHGFTETTEAVLIEATRLNDELKAVENRLPPLNTELCLATPLVPRLTDLDAQTLDTLQWVINVSELGAVIHRTQIPDGQVVRSLLQLIAAGYIGPK